MTETLADGVDPATPDQIAYRYALADKEQVALALATAVAAQTRGANALFRHGRPF